MKHRFSWILLTLLPPLLIIPIFITTTRTTAAKQASAVAIEAEITTPANSWVTKTVIPTGRGDAAAVVISDTIYVVGGWITDSTDVMEAYVPMNDSWSSKAPMNTPRNNLTAAVVNGKIYAIGGWSVTTNTTAVEVYDPTTDTWTDVAPLPEGNNGLRAAAVNGKIYTFGGWDGITVTNAVMMYDPQTDIWTTRTSIPTARMNMAVTAVDGKIYAFGGEVDGNSFRTVGIYDPASDIWSRGMDMPTPLSSHAATVIGDKIYVVGGGNVNLQYDPAADNWLILTPMRTGRWGVTATTVSNTLYAIGGWPDMGNTNINEAYIPPDASTPSITLMANIETPSIYPLLNAFAGETNIPLVFQETGDLSDYLLGCAAAHNCPDAAIVPNIGLIKDLTQQGDILPLDSVIPSFDTYYTTTWRELGSNEGALYGLPLGASSKSMVWYRPQAFAAISATAPSTWTGLLELSDNLVTDGQTPFAIGAFSNEASGWPLTDIFENILVRMAGPDTHRQLANHEIAWTDPVVISAMQQFTDIVGVEAYQAGGTTGTLTTPFWEAVNIVFGASPTATMYFGANWVQSMIDPALTPLVDYNYFDFPTIDPIWGQPIVGGADLVILFSDSPEAAALLQFLVTPAAGEAWVSSTPGRISPNSGVNLDVYANPIDRAVAEQLANVGEFLYDLDDQLPYELQSYVWGAMLDFVAHQDQLMDILQGIEDKATEIQGGPYNLYLPAIVNP